MTQPLMDSFGRVHRDLRISVTDRCNFRCTYCMPEEGMQWLRREDVLSFEEIERIARLMVDRYGITSIRLTGGEPTVRAHLPDLIRRLAELPVDLALTTNGTSLSHQAEALAAAGLKRINISIDTFRRDRFLAITRRDELATVLAGIDAALAAGLSPVKLNAVMMRGVNDDELLDFIQFGREKGVTVRFIEFMPLDAQGGWSRDQVVTYDEILARIGAKFPFEPLGSNARGAAPAERFRFLDGRGEFGIIASVTQSFCESCDRVRLTAEGQLRSCLFALDHTDLRAMLRMTATDDELAQAVADNIAAKWAGHQIGQVHFIRPSKSMSQIGG